MYRYEDGHRRSCRKFDQGKTGILLADETLGEGVLLRLARLDVVPRYIAILT
jgi:hypothetical protein